MSGKIFQQIADNQVENSLSHQMRSKRFTFFKACLQQLPKPITILDIGGTMSFWQSMQFKDAEVSIILLNLEEAQQLQHPFTSVQGDATALTQFADQSIDIVFSNSVIEHLFNWENQQKMAAEVLRVGKQHFIQTPNYWFPIEPHWVFPLFQFLPPLVKRWMTQHLSLGHIGKINDPQMAKKQVDEIKLLTKNELKQLFPQSRIYEEKFAGFNKSFIAHSFSV
jgi:predicted SAM-dependent methyltransferase